jgi:uncharacterized protein with PIN domain
MSSQMREAINTIFFGSQSAIDNDKCPLCNKDVTNFKDEISLEEYGLSGMCQTCQDETFFDRDE